MFVVNVSREQDGFVPRGHPVRVPAHPSVRVRFQHRRAHLPEGILAGEVVQNKKNNGFSKPGVRVETGLTRTDGDPMKPYMKTGLHASRITSGSTARCPSCRRRSHPHA